MAATRPVMAVLFLWEEFEVVLSPDENYTAAEVAPYLKCEIHRVQELARLHILPCFYLGRHRRFRGAELLAFIESGGKRLDGPGGWRRSRESVDIRSARQASVGRNNPRLREMTPTGGGEN